MKRKHKCFALFSGGLDSMLTVKYMEKLGYEVLPIFFSTPFFNPQKAQIAADRIDVNLIIHDVSKEYLEMIKKPRYGFGKNMNPCIDCHGLMFRIAGELMEEYSVDFIISGEVMGQRPMSQRKDALNSVAKLSNIKDLLVRPLSQKLLTDTLPIREGWVNKKEMLDIQGRGRYRQIELAAQLGIKEFENPGGGCLLTDVGYSRKVKDIYENNMFNMEFIKFLTAGRHFRISPEIKLIVGKDNNDNDRIAEQIDKEIVMLCNDFPGPLGVIQGIRKPTDEEVKTCAAILLRYCRKAPESSRVKYGFNHNLINLISCDKMNEEEVKKFQIN